METNGLHRLVEQRGTVYVWMWMRANVCLPLETGCQENEES